MLRRAVHRWILDLPPRLPGPLIRVDARRYRRHSQLDRVPRPLTERLGPAPLAQHSPRALPCPLIAVAHSPRLPQQWGANVETRGRQVRWTVAPFPDG